MGERLTVETTLKKKRADAHAAAPISVPSKSLGDQIYQLNLGTILSAHLYGHIDQAYTLRAIAKAIQECLV